MGLGFRGSGHPETLQIRIFFYKTKLHESLHTQIETSDKPTPLHPIKLQFGSLLMRPRFKFSSSRICSKDHMMSTGLQTPKPQTLLGGSWDLVSMVISTLTGVINIVTPITTLVTKSHDPLSKLGPKH